MPSPSRRDWPRSASSPRWLTDASTWDRCDAECSPERGYYYSASKHSAGQPIVAGWNYQWICQLNWAPDSWTAPLDVMRLSPFLDPVTATVEQIRRLVALLPDEGEVPLLSSMPAMTPSPSGTTWATCAAKCSLAFATIASFTEILPLAPTDRQRPADVPHGTGGGSSVRIGERGESPTTAWSRLTPAMAPSACRPGTDCTPS
jgi:hypothetical protein